IRIFSDGSFEVSESDIFFNDAFPWSVTPGGTPGRFDFQSVATHEIGHFLGLGHSGVGVMETNGDRRELVEGSAAMFPFAFPRGSTIGRTLTPDDIAGASALYPTASFSQETGSLSGSITKNGEGLLGAQVLTFNPFTGEMIGFFTDGSGEFQIRGLKPGPHVVRVNPITDPASPDDFGFDEAEVDLDFSDALFKGRAEVQPAGNTTGIDVEVQP
ncbi:MAG: matrixin family metalloprotease, partial [Acidobacteriota bacterium]